MTRVRLLALAAFAVLALSGIASATASAEIAILTLTGTVKELSASATGEKSVLEGKKTKKTITGTKTTGTLENCLPLAGKEGDTDHCDGLLTFSGTKQGAVSCRSENTAGTKDPVETILVKILGLLADEKSKAGVLEPIVLAQVLGVDGKELIINCGAVKEKVHGWEPCLLLPGLVQTTKAEIICKQKEGALETGTCEETKLHCEELAKNPLEASLNGTEFEPAAEEIELKGSFNKDVTIDD